MAAVTMGQSQGSFTSSIVLYKLDRQEAYATCDLAGVAVYDLGLVGKRYCAVAEDSLHFIDQKGRAAASYSYDGGVLRRCSLGGAALGLVCGGLTLFVAVWAMQRFGWLLTPELIDGTTLLKFFATQTPLGLLAAL